MNIVIETKGTQGDVGPLLALGRGLSARGHGVSFLTNCHYAELVNRAGLDFEALDNREEFEEFIRDLRLLQNPRGSALFFERHLMGKALHEYESIAKRCHNRDSVLIVRHMSGLGPSLAAEVLGVPLVPVFTAAAQVGALPLLKVLCEEVLSEKINSLRGKIGLSAITDWGTWLKWPRSIGSWPSWFDDASGHQLDGLAMVGFMNDDASETGEVPPEVTCLLKSSARTVLITGGTGRWSLDAEFYRRSVEGCRAAGFEGILVTQYACLVPENLPSTVRWFKSLPFATVMPQVSVVVHHGGAGTMARSIEAGTPQLALVAGGDRPDNGTKLQELGVGERLFPAYWDARSIATSLRRLGAAVEIRRRCRLVSEQLRECDSVTTACNVIEEVISKFVGSVQLGTAQ